MADEYWLDDFTTLDLETDEATPTSTPVAGIQGVSIVPSVSIERLYTADSTKINTQKQHEFSVAVNITYSTWDNTFIEQWLGGGGGSSATSYTDTSDPQRFQLTGDFDSEAGSDTLSTKITGITFEEPPLFEGDRGEYVEWDLSGTGTDMTDATVS